MLNIISPSARRFPFICIGSGRNGRNLLLGHVPFQAHKGKVLISGIKQKSKNTHRVKKRGVSPAILEQLQKKKTNSELGCHQAERLVPVFCLPRKFQAFRGRDWNNPEGGTLQIGNKLKNYSQFRGRKVTKSRFYHRKVNMWK